MLRRLLVGVGLAACSLLLTGCHLDGTVDLSSRDIASFDLQATDISDDFCPTDPDVTYSEFERTSRGVRGEWITSATGQRMCHVTGRLPLRELSLLGGVTWTDVAEYSIFETDLEADHSEWPSGNITVHLPGDVVSSNQGVVSGSTVRLSDLPALDNHLKIAFLSRPGPPNAVIWLVAGVAGGVTVTLLVVSLARWGAERRAGSPRVLEQGPPEQVEEPADVTVGETPTLPPPLHERDGRAEPAAEPQPPPDHTMWAPP